ncbi:MAG: cysteate synthase [Bacteroidetes bacterium]|nr:cysteate synthase [Bacteroidota bacterium]MBU1580847.1 cysteate synthase [Bacteroidota bacterium]MBU2466549.1 cysteate synthase [Bacteroidota bacterium]MBU2558397.1 cysteate synthase [Bacteroidota bacterium]
MTDSFQPTAYQLQSIASGKNYDDSGWLLDPPGEEIPSLIRAIYTTKQIKLRGEAFGLYTFADWLPINRMLKGSSAPVTYKSKGLAGELGLKNLYITFSGYWPEKGAFMPTCSFKETEAYSVGGRMKENQQNEVLVVASAGNTARAFAQVCSDNQIPLLLCVPEASLDALWFGAPLNSCVKLLATEKGSDYFDAIHLSNQIIPLEGFYAEGGAKNVARRDGMGTTVLSATTFIGRIPDYYFQAIGSGTGAIAAWEANLRFIDDGRFGSHKMKLMISQNYPFVPIQHAWNAHSREMLHYDSVEARNHVEEIDAKVLSNRKPPYPIIGGLFDALSDAGGAVLSATNAEARAANKLFQQSEGNDLHPAAAIATASLINAVKEGLVEKDAVIMLNITGGGEALFKKTHQLHFLKPNATLPIDASPDQIKSVVGQLKWEMKKPQGAIKN